MSEKTDPQRMEKIVSLCKRRGFIFQSSEIYGGLNGCWDYGPLGVELKRNVKEYWWRTMVRERDDVVGMDGAILMSRAVLKASGHEDTFSDLLVEDPLTNKRYRHDQVEPRSGIVYHFGGVITPNDYYDQTGSVINASEIIRLASLLSIPGISDLELYHPHEVNPTIQRDLARMEKVLGREAAQVLADRGQFVPFSVLLPLKNASEEAARKKAYQYYQVKWGILNPIYAGIAREEVHESKDYGPESGARLTYPRPFNLMFRTQMGAASGESAIAYLRPETAQSIFVQFKNVLDTARKKLPFGIAQIGKAFRNEINPRNYIFRSREFEQMELEYFCRAEEGMKWLEYWKEERIKFYENIGLPREKLHVLTVPDADRAFYSKGTYDIEYDFPFGRQELEGVAYRTDYDLKQHQEASGKPLDYFDEETKQRFIPHVVEPSAGVDRTVLALLCEAYDEETVTDEKGKSETRTVMRFHPRIAPVKVGVFPLLKNNEQLVAKAREIVASLRAHMNVFYDETGAIGRRYRRQDEAGTPFGVTVDFETLGEKDAALRDTVTLRERDSMRQERVKIPDLLDILLVKIR